MSAYELSTNTTRGFQLAMSHACLDEALNRRSGLPVLSEADFTHGERVAKLRYWVNQLDAAGSEAECYGMLCYLGAAFAGAAMARDELDVSAGDEDTTHHVETYKPTPRPEGETREKIRAELRALRRDAA